MQGIHDRVEAVRSRQQRQWLWQTVSVGLVVGGILGCGLAVTRLLGVPSLSLAWLAATVIVCPLVGLIYGCAVPRRAGDAALAIDRSYRLKDRIATAFSFMHQQTPQSPLQQLQVDDAHCHVTAVDPTRVAPLRTPRSCGWGLSLSAVALLIAFLSGPREELNAAVSQNEVVRETSDK